MKTINRQIKIPKTYELSTDYIKGYFEGLDVIRWAIIEVGEDFYLVDAVFMEDRL